MNSIKVIKISSENSTKKPIDFLSSSSKIKEILDPFKMINPGL